MTQEISPPTGHTGSPTTRPGRYTALITALTLGALSLGLGTWSGWQWDHHFSRMLPLLDHLNTARDAVSEGYVWVEAHLRDAPAAGEDTIAEAFDRAVAAVDLALATRDPTAPDDELAGRLRSYRDAVRSTAELAGARARLHSRDTQTRLRDLQLFTALHGLNMMAKTIDLSVHQEWEAILESQRRLQRWALGSWVLLVGIVSAALLVAGRRRARAEDDLAHAHRVLEQRVEERTTELRTALASLSLEVDQRRRAQRALSYSEADLRALTSQLITVQEEERSRLARELHDGTTQDLGAVKFQVEHARSRILAGDTDTAAAACGETISLLQDTLDAIRTTYMALRPFHLDDLGLSAALTWLCREFREHHPGIRLELELPTGEAGLSGEFSVTIFRIVQESLDNVAQHSGASAATVSLAVGADVLELVVEDDGKGFPLPGSGGEAPALGVGLRTIRERARSTGGTLELDSAPGRNTRVTVRWSLEALPPAPDPG